MILYEGLNNLTWFMGIVQDIADPKKEGRVRVRAFGFHPIIAEGTVSTEDLPWATVLVNNVSVSAKLAVGELVFGAFLDGRDAQQPLIFGAIPTPKFGIPTLEPTGPAGNPNDPDQPNIPAGANVTQQQAYNLALQAGFSSSEARTMAAIAVGESGLNSSAYNGNVRTGDNSYGLWQINMLGDLGPERRREFGIQSNDELFDPLTNARAAYEIYKQQGFNAWSVYRNGVHNQYLDNIPANESLTLPSTAPYTPLVPSTIDSYGQGALPPQRTGEGLQHTPLAPALINFQKEKANGGLNHPGLSVGSSHNTTVINASYNGSYIEMHGGDGENNEHINIIHKSGAHIALDQNGNVTIGAIGRLHVVSINDFEQQIGGHTTNISDGGYSVRVENGGIQLHSVGDLSISSNSNINIAAAGDIVLNSGTSLDISSARVGLSATAGGISVLASEGIQLQSVGDTTVKSANFVVNAGTLGMEATDGNAIIKGAQVRLNDGSVPTVAATSGAVGVEKPPTAGITTKREASPTPGGVSVNQIDDTV